MRGGEREEGRYIRGIPLVIKCVQDFIDSASNEQLDEMEEYIFSQVHEDFEVEFIECLHEAIKKRQVT